MTYRLEDMLLEKALMNNGAMNNEEQVNDHIEEDDHSDKIIEDDTTNKLIHDTFNFRMDKDEDGHENDDFDDFHDLPLIEKVYTPLYEGSIVNILSIILLIMNLKAMNGVSNRSVTQMLRYVVYCIRYI